ncbi:hypothetical protein D3C73_1251540 [compost metagenome]
MFSTALAIFCWAAGISACTFAATAAKIAAPSAQHWSEATICSGRLRTSQQACMMTGFLRAMPPSAITLFTAMPCSVKHSIMARAPNAVAAINPPNSAGASVARLRSVMTPFRRWLALGVRRPLNQSSTTGRWSSDGFFAHASVNAGSSCFWLALICVLSSGCCAASCSSGQLSTRLNQA